MNAIVNCVTSVPDPRRGNHRKHALGETPSMCKCASVQVCKRASVSHQYQRQLVATLVLGTGAGGLHTCTFAHSKDSPAGAACLRNVAGIAAANAGGGVVAIDGKAVKRGKKRGGKTPYIVNAWSAACGIVLGEVKVDEKSNEIPAIPEVLKTLGLEGCIVTVDAAGCQKNILRQIVVDCKADAVLALKDNQKTLHDEMLLLFEKERESSPHLFPRYDAPVEKNSGRIERRSCWQTGHVGWFEDIGEWQGLRSVIMVEAERSARNVETGEWETSTERRLYISSLKVDPELALEVTRRHWGVESMHWTLDVTYGEDYCRARTKHAAANRASVRRMAASLTIPWARKHKCTVKEAMMFANQSKEARLEMLS